MINDQNDLDMEYKPLDIELIRKNISTYSSEKLCEIIVCDRYFGCYQDIAIICMRELAHRRQEGSDFVFEEYINNSLKELPELQFSGLNLRDILQQAVGRKINL